MTDSPAVDGGLGSTRLWLRIAATTSLVGIGASATGQQLLGAWLTVLSLIGVLAGLHRLGRLGADPPLTLPTQHRTTRKRRRKRQVP